MMFLKKKKNSTFAISVFIAVVLAVVLIVVVHSNRQDNLLRDVTFNNLNAEKYNLSESDDSNYFHVNPNFSFTYPKNFTVGNFDELNHKIVLVQNAKKEHAFQIAISSFDEPNTVLTVDRVKKDLPNLKMQDPLQINIGSQGSGVSFVDSGTRMREVWFVYNSFLYQITATRESEGLLESVLKTWRFD